MQQACLLHACRVAIRAVCGRKQDKHHRMFTANSRQDSVCPQIVGRDAKKGEAYWQTVQLTDISWDTAAIASGMDNGVPSIASMRMVVTPC